MTSDRAAPKDAITDGSSVQELAPPFDNTERDELSEVWVPSVLIDNYLRFLSDSEVRVLLWLVHHCWWHGQENVSYADMLGKHGYLGCGVSKPSLVASLGRLEKLGILVRTRRYGPDGGNLPSSYRILWPRIEIAPEDAIRRKEQDKRERRAVQEHRKMSGLRKIILAMPGTCCHHCGSTQDLTLDLITPFKHGGRAVAGNIQVLCRSCNSRKGTKVDGR